MNNSIWKLATLAGVVGIGVLVVLQFQRGLDGYNYKSSALADELRTEEAAGDGFDDPFADKAASPRDRQPDDSSASSEPPENVSSDDFNASWLENESQHEPQSADRDEPAPAGVRTAAVGFEQQAFDPFDDGDDAGSDDAAGGAKTPELSEDPFGSDPPLRSAGDTRGPALSLFEKTFDDDSPTATPHHLGPQRPGAAGSASFDDDPFEADPFETFSENGGEAGQTAGTARGVPAPASRDDQAFGLDDEFGQTKPARPPVADAASVGADADVTGADAGSIRHESPRDRRFLNGEADGATFFGTTDAETTTADTSDADTRNADTSDAETTDADATDLFGGNQDEAGGVPAGPMLSPQFEDARTFDPARDADDRDAVNGRDAVNDRDPLDDAPDARDRDRFDYDDDRPQPPAATVPLPLPFDEGDSPDGESHREPNHRTQQNAQFDNGQSDRVPPNSVPSNSAPLNAVEQDNVSPKDLQQDNSLENADGRTAVPAPDARPKRFEPPPDAGRLLSATDDLDGDGVVSGVAPAGAQRPQLRIEKNAPPHARLGEPLIYSVVIRNVGDSTAHQVVVEDRIPRGTKLTGTIPQAELIEKRLVWRLGDLAPGDEKKILIRVIPVAAGQIGSVATVNFVAEVAAKTVVTSPHLGLKLNAPEQARLGEPVVLQFTVENNGSSDATDVVLRDIVPDVLHHPGGDDLEYEIGELPAGQSREVKLTLSAVKTGAGVNRAVVTAEGGLSAEVTAHIDVVGPSLQITRTGPGSRFMQTRGVYNNVVTNESGRPLVNARVVESVPRGMEFVEASHGGVYDAAERTVSWTIDRLDAGEQAKLQITLTPRELGTQVSVVNAFDGDGNQVKAVSQTKVLGFASLAGAIVGGDVPIAVGERAAFQLRIRNRGTKPAHHVAAALVVPEEVQVVSANSSRDQVRKGLVEFAPIRQLDPQEEITLQLVLKASAAGDARLQLRLQAAEMQRPLVHEEALILYSLDVD